MAKEWRNWAGDQRCTPARIERPAGREAEWATEVAVLDDRHLRLAGAENVIPLPDRGEPA